MFSGIIANVTLEHFSYCDVHIVNVSHHIIVMGKILITVKTFNCLFVSIHVFPQFICGGKYLLTMGAADYFGVIWSGEPGNNAFIIITESQLENI